ncbi:hypothetical protein LXL04_026525 [Taraxacum kok-saghyz]
MFFSIFLFPVIGLLKSIKLSNVGIHIMDMLLVVFCVVKNSSSYYIFITLPIFVLTSITSSTSRAKCYIFSKPLKELLSVETKAHDGSLISIDSNGPDAHVLEGAHLVIRTTKMKVCDDWIEGLQLLEMLHYLDLAIRVIVSCIRVRHEFTRHEFGKHEHDTNFNSCLRYQTRTRHGPNTNTTRTRHEFQFVSHEHEHETKKQETNEQNSVIGNIKNIQQSGTLRTFSNRF